MDKYLTDKKYWQKRVKCFDRLQWAKREEYLSKFVEMCELKKSDEVLDLGTGIGTVAFSIYNKVKVKSVIGVDYSEAMLTVARKHNHTDNVEFINADIRRMSLPDSNFSLVTARMVFHHLLWGIERAIVEAKRVLMPGGLLCLSEGVPPDRSVEDFYKTMFALKEKRRTFFPEDLKRLFIEGGFREIKMREYIMHHCSIRNWLDNAGSLSPEIKNQIYQMHINLQQEGKNAYNMKVTPNDCFIDMKFIIISGRK